MGEHPFAGLGERLPAVEHALERGRRQLRRAEEQRDRLAPPHDVRARPPRRRRARSRPPRRRRPRSSARQRLGARAALPPSGSAVGRGGVEGGAVARPAGGGPRGDLGAAAAVASQARSDQLAQDVARLRAVEAGQRREARPRRTGERLLAGVVLRAVQAPAPRRRADRSRARRPPPGLARAHPGDEQQAVDVDEAASAREPGRSPLAGGARAGDRPASASARADAGSRRRGRPVQRGQRRVSLDQRQPRRACASPSSGGAVADAGGVEELAETEALVGDGVRDLVEERDALARRAAGSRGPAAAARGIVGGDRVAAARPRRPQLRVVGGGRRSGRAASGSVSSAPKLDGGHRARRARRRPARLGGSRVTGRAGSVPRNGRRRAAATWPTRRSTSPRTAPSVTGASPPASTSAAATAGVVGPATGRSLR